MQGPFAHRCCGRSGAHTLAPTLPGTSTSPSASPILVEQNCLGIVATEVVQEPVVAQPCQSYLPPRSPYNFSYPAVAD